MAWVNVFNTVFHGLVKDPFISTRQFALQHSFSLVYKSNDPCQSIIQGCKSFRFSLISDFFIKSNFKGARANLKTTF